MSVTLASFGDGAPSGEDLEYEQVFTELNLAAQPGEERQAGNEIIPGQDPNPADVAEKAVAVLAQSHDLRAAILWGYGRLRMDGLPGYAEATSYIRGCLEQFWDTCHPQLDADDDDDPTMRVNAVLGLCDPAMTLKAIRMAPLAKSPNFGIITLQDIAIAEGEADPPPDMDAPPDLARVAAAFRDTPDDAKAATYAGARQVLEDLQAIDAVFSERTPGRGPTLDPILKPVKRIVARLAAEVGEPEAALAEELPAGDGAGAAAAPAAKAAPGTINSSTDVQQALDRIIEYYRRNEPSSPVPIILERARRLVGADFVTIVTDLAPGGMDNVRLVGGLPEPEY